MLKSYIGSVIYDEELQLVIYFSVMPRVSYPVMYVI